MPKGCPYGALNVWTDRQIGRLCDLWAQEPRIPTAEIGRQLDMSKNSIVGKAHRLGLPSRPSPIKHDGIRATPVRKPRITLPPLLALPSLIADIVIPPPPKPVFVAPDPAEPSPEPFFKTRPSQTCCWPVGDPGTRSFRFCDAEIPASRVPYCAEHRKVAFTRTVPARDESPAAA